MSNSSQQPFSPVASVTVSPPLSLLLSEAHYLLLTFVVELLSSSNVRCECRPSFVHWLYRQRALSHVVSCTSPTTCPSCNPSLSNPALRHM